MNMDNVIKICASCLFSVSFCAIVFVAYRVLEPWLPLCKNHPGIVLVAVGVLGEMACDWKKEKHFREKLKKWFGVMLMAGLLLEVWEAIKSDGQILALEKQGQTLQFKIQPRTITAANKKDFTNLVFVVSGAHKNPLSQLENVKVFVGVADYETTGFAKQLSGFFREIGLKSDSEIISIPDFMILQNPTNGLSTPGVICCYCSTNNESLGSPIAGTPMMTPNGNGRGIDCLCRVMNGIGLKTTIFDGKDLQIFGKKLMHPGEFAVFVPEKVPY